MHIFKIYIAYILLFLLFSELSLVGMALDVVD